METDKHIYFFERNDNEFDWLSQMHYCSFSDNGVKYSSVEQYVTAKKAELFGDDNIRKAVMKCKNPFKIHKLGLEIGGFDQKRWAEVRETIVYNGYTLKFQDEELRERLLATGDKVLAFASPNDKLWGIGAGLVFSYKYWSTDGDVCGRTVEQMPEQKEWKGRNLLGSVIMRVRKDLRATSTANSSASASVSN